MEAHGKFTDWRFNAIETLGFGFSLAAVAVSITVWALFTFQTQKDAALVKADLENRIISVESQMNQLRSSVDSVAKDVSYIRGRLEPKN